MPNTFSLSLLINIRVCTDLLHPELRQILEVQAGLAYL